MLKGFLKEFKEFAVKGNMLDMAVGLIMGSAFGGLVSQLNESFITPLLSIFLKDINFDQLVLTIGGGEFTYGKFLSVLINFVIQALVLFLLLRFINSFRRKEEPAPAVTKICPYCKSEIHIEATKCPHCASEQPKE